MALSTQHPGRSPQTLVEVRPEGLPPNLLLAKEAIEQEDFRRAKALLDGTTIEQVQQLISQDPSRVDVMAMVGLMFMRLRQWDKAEPWFRDLIQQRPDPLALQQLAEICYVTGRFCQATAYRRQAMDLDPEDVEIWVAYGLDLTREGRIDEGLALLRRVLDRCPDHAEAHSKLLFSLHFVPGQDRKGLLEEHRRWGRLHAPLSLARRDHLREPDPDRCLRIGYLSADFRTHSVAYTFEALLDHHDRGQVETVAYGAVGHADVVTGRLADKLDVYRDVRSLENAALADLIEQDQIDILVAIGGHTQGHRLQVLAYKPAPIQVDFQGINTSGIEQVDYKMTDALTDPPGSEPYYVERLIRLPQGIHCYRPPAFAPAVGPLPAHENGFITFGSFNHVLKINPDVVSLWSRVLLANPTARLLMKFIGGDEPMLQGRLLAQFERLGVPRDRITMCGWRSVAEHLALYNRVDIALDTYPFNGCMTTLEGLWMGVPVVTLVGGIYVSRMGLSLLHPLGLDTFATSSPDEFVAKATVLSRSLESLSKLRATMRQRMMASPLCDGRAYAQAVEQAYRQMWRRWCTDQKTEARSQKPETRSQKPETGNQKPEDRTHVGSSDADRMEFFISESNDLRFTISKKGLPAFLVQAASAVQAGDVSQATAILNDQAVEQIRRMAPQDPAYVDAAFMLAMLLAKTEQPDQAEHWYKEVLGQRPHPVVYFELANLARSRGLISQALEYQQKAVDLSPSTPSLQAMLADHLIKAGRALEGIEILRRVVDRAPDRISHSKILWHLHQGDDLDQAALFQEHRRWADLYAPRHLARTSHDNDRDPDRRLRVGYISPDFCGHSVAYFFEALLDGHDAGQVEAWGYGNVVSQDVVTERLQGKFHAYRNICGTDDEAVVRLIEQDRIDILVDLAGHTGDNRLAVLAHRPAPVQVSFLGYPDTTGMVQIDYRFTDAWADLPDAQQFYTEQLVRLPSGFICYRPPGFAPGVGPLPAQRNGFITFGSFNNNAKINARVLGLWAQILKAVPDARLLLKFEGGDDVQVRQRYLDALAERGIETDRVQVLGRRPVQEHLDLYNQVDMALDTYPYHGTTTTCEALWMGVPTVTLVGEHHASRVGLSLLTRVGLEVFAAATDRDYVAKAAAFARELDNLAVIRRSLRNMMQASTLCRARAYAQDVEAAYRRMWRTWCSQGDPHAR